MLKFVSQSLLVFLKIRSYIVSRSDSVSICNNKFLFFDVQISRPIYIIISNLIRLKFTFFNFIFLLNNLLVFSYLYEKDFFELKA